MSKINQKHGIPRMPGGQAFSLSRGKYLDGTVRCYYGPGQPPNAAPENGVTTPDGAGDSLLPYAKPTAWPAAGSLLRVPQCVNLSTLMLRYNKPDPELFVTTEPPGGFYVPYTYSASRPPIYHDEYVRLKALFGRVKAAIESIRPGRTYVQDVDWLPSDWEEIHGTNVHYACRGRGYLHMLAPPADTDPYLGTNFLHVYAGFKAFDRTSFDDGVFFYTRVISDFSTSPPGDDFHHQIARPRVVAAYPNFNGYAVKLYGVNIPYSPLPDWTDVTLAPPYVGNVSLQHDLDIFNFNQRDFIRITNENFANLRDFSNTFLSESADDLSAYGFSYEGVSSDLTDDSLKSLIASHFGFDPETGVDVG